MGAIRHTFQSAISDDPVAEAAGEVTPTRWNADHDLSTLTTNDIQNTVSTVASHATTADIWSVTGNVIDWTGTATTTDFPDAPNAGATRVLICAGACSFTQGAALTVIGGVVTSGTITLEAGDIVVVRALTVSTFSLEIIPKLVNAQKRGWEIVSLTTATATATHSMEYYNSTAGGARRQTFQDLWDAIPRRGFVQFKFSTTTTDSDPGGGMLRFNNGTLASVTKIYADNGDSFSSASTTAFLDWLDDAGTSSDRGTLVITRTSGGMPYCFKVTGSVVDGTGYRKIDVTPLFSSGVSVPSNNEVLGVHFIPATTSSGGSGDGAVASIETKTATYNITSSDRGKYFKMTGATAADIAVTSTLTAATAGSGFNFIVEHAGTGTSGANKKLVFTPTTSTVDGQTTITDYPGSIRLYASDGTNWVTTLLRGGYVEVKVADSPFTLTHPSGFTRAYVKTVASGGSGAGGRGAAAGNDRGGGGGGGGGKCTDQWFSPVDLPIGSSTTCTIGAGVAGGTAGNHGAAGNNTTFGSKVTAYAGGGGGFTNTGGAGGGGGGATQVGGSATSGSGTTGGGVLVNGSGVGGSKTDDSGAGGGNAGAVGGQSWKGGGGGGGGTVPGSGAVGAAGGSSGFSAAGGGGGGGVNFANSLLAAAAGGNTGVGTVTGGGGGGAAGSASNGSDGSSPTELDLCGRGGGGGAGNTAGTGYNGGAGGFPGGGGGGGGGGTSTGGAGGASGDGVIRLWYLP